MERSFPFVRFLATKTQQFDETAQLQNSRAGLGSVFLFNAPSSFTAERGTGTSPSRPTQPITTVLATSQSPFPLLFSLEQKMKWVLRV